MVSRSFDLFNSIIYWSRWSVDLRWMIDSRCYIHPYMILLKYRSQVLKTYTRYIKCFNRMYFFTFRQMNNNEKISFEGIFHWFSLFTGEWMNMSSSNYDLPKGLNNKSFPNVSVMSIVIWVGNPKIEVDIFEKLHSIVGRMKNQADLINL